MFRRQLSAPRLALGCLAAVATACAPAHEIAAPPATPPAAPATTRGGEPLQTDSLAYTAAYRSGEGAYRAYGFRLIARFTNRAAGPVFLASCYPGDRAPMFSVRLVGDTAGSDGLGSIFNRAWACVGHDQQLEVAPGATRIDTLALVGPNAVAGGRPLGRFDGRLRLRYQVQTCRGDGRCGLPTEEGLSNAFDVTVPR